MPMNNNNAVKAPRETMKSISEDDEDFGTAEVTLRSTTSSSSSSANSRKRELLRLESLVRHQVQIQWQASIDRRER